MKLLVAGGFWLGQVCLAAGGFWRPLVVAAGSPPARWNEMKRTLEQVPNGLRESPGARSPGRGQAEPACAASEAGLELPKELPKASDGRWALVVAQVRR